MTGCLVEIEKTVDFHRVRLAVGDEDSFPHLSVQARVESSLQPEGECRGVSQPLWVFNLEVFCKDF